MLKWVKQMFYVPKYGKVTDKVLISRLTMHISIIIVCLISMSLSAFAYFSNSVTSGTNVIKAAYFDVEISIEKTQHEVNGTQRTNADKSTLQKSGNQYTAELEADSYAVTINKAGTAKTGFVVVKIGDAIYHTEQLDDVNNAVVFTLKLESASEVTFIPNWGTSSNYSQVASIKEIDEYIADGETVNVATMILDSAPGGNTEPSAETTESTMPSEPTGQTQSTYQLNVTDITANVGITTWLQLLDTATNTPVMGLTWYVSEPDYISIEVLEDGVKVTGTADTVETPGVLYGRVYCEYMGETYTCIFRIKDPKEAEQLAESGTSEETEPETTEPEVGESTENQKS